MIATQIFAHRGSASTHPENTMIAFLEAERVGADGIELDVQLSKDGEVVVIHDEKLNRTTNGTGYVKDFSLKQLKSLDASYTFFHQKGNATIPTLEEVLKMLSGNAMLLNIELKNGILEYPGLEEKVIQLIEYYNMQNRVILSSFNHNSLVYCYQLAPYIETAPLYRDQLFKPWIYASAIGAKAIHPNIKVASQQVIVNSIKEGIKVRPYTINNIKKMQELFFIQCSGIFTDYPKEAVAVRREMNNKRIEGRESDLRYF